ncbi:hypothetical protein U9M48_040850 [Paspalum notatum var. saurae]|uniref:Uncharacterized protein n=1 Tax=Paspalum notatum var. saurae TaxID=547442 RepID=A0AAQ3UP54_PASNO
MTETKDILVRDMPIIIFAYAAPTMRSIGTTRRESIPTSQQHAKATIIATTNVEKFDIKSGKALGTSKGWSQNTSIHTSLIDPPANLNGAIRRGRNQQQAYEGLQFLKQSLVQGALDPLKVLKLVGPLAWEPAYY